MIDISIIIVAWNSAAFIEECLQSIKSKSKTSKNEVLVIDNGSQDDTVKVVQKRFADAIIIQNKYNIGFSKAANLGISRSKGKYIFLLNPDTRFESNVTQTLADFLDVHLEAAAVSPKVLESDGTVSRFSARELPSLLNIAFRQFGLRKKFSDHSLFGRETLAGWNRKTLRQVPYINGAAIMIRRQIFEKYGLLDVTLPMYFEDLEFSARLNRNGEKIFVVPEAVLMHLGMRSAVLSPHRSILMAMEDGEAPRLYFRLYKSHFQSILYKILIFTGSAIRLLSYHLRYISKNSLDLWTINTVESIQRSRALMRWTLLPPKRFMKSVEQLFPPYLEAEPYVEKQL